MKKDDLVTSSLVGYAVLRANYNANAGSYLDNFVGFVLDALAASHPRFLQRDEIAEQIRSEYGIAIPDLVVGQLLRRMRKQKLTEEAAQDCYTVTAEGHSRAPAIQELATGYRAQQAELEYHFREFVTKKFPEHLEILTQDVGAALQSYFEQHAVPLLSRSIKGAPLKIESRAGFDYLISGFVAELAEIDQARFNYVVEASKGAILAAVLEMDTSGFKDSLVGLQIYFDTPVVINALGFAGEVLQRAAIQTIELAQSQGAQSLLFTHSMKEIRGILNGAQSSLRAGSRSMSTSAVYLHFVESGYSAVDVMEIEESLEERIAELGLSIAGKPANYATFGLDEARLDNQLQEVVRYREAATRLYDVDSLSAIHRLREGSVPQKFERAKAIFVTSNSALVRAAREFSATDRRAKFPLALHDTAAAAILWVRSASMEDEVPREQLLATAYASMQPNQTLWAKYLEEIDQLEARAEVSADEAAVLRATTVAREALMDETLGDGELMTADLPLQVLDRVRSGIETPLKALVQKFEVAHATAAVASIEYAQAAAKEADARKRVEADLASMNTRLAESEKQAVELKRKQLSALDSRVAKTTRVSVRIGLSLVFTSIVIIAFVIALKSFVGNEIENNLIFACVMAGLATLGLVPQFFPGSILEWLRPLENSIIARRRKNGRKKLGFDG
jgi:hypothetical protein